MRPKPENSSQKKRNTGQLWCAVSLSECGKPTPMVVLWGEPRHPTEHRAGERETNSIGNKGKGSQCPQHSLGQAHVLG